MVRPDHRFTRPMDPARARRPASVMGKRVLFLQGGGEGAYKDDAILAASLGRELGADYHVRYPAMPNEDEPDYTTWKQRITNELEAMGDGAILVGHSIGASVLIKLLTESEPKQSLAGIFLIAAPFWHDDEVWRWKEVELPKDVSTRLPDGVPLFLYHGRDDEIVPFSHVAMYAKAFPRAVVRRLDGRNHQLNDDLSAVAADIKRVR
jgi:predicted alpha/beta hydrolase family esterase